VFKAETASPYPIMTGEFYLTALTSISTFLVTIAGFMMSAVNLKDVCKAKA